jgi:transposase
MQQTPLKANPVYAARYRHLTSREQNKLTPMQAQTVIAAAILRQLHAVITGGTAWDPSFATRGTADAAAAAPAAHCAPTPGTPTTGPAPHHP